jgi:hypothetical protein
MKGIAGGIAGGKRWDQGESKGTIFTLCTCFDRYDPGLDSTTMMHHSACPRVVRRRMRGVCVEYWSQAALVETRLSGGAQANLLASPRVASHRHCFSFDEHRKGGPRRLDLLW